MNNDDIYPEGSFWIVSGCSIQFSPNELVVRNTKMQVTSAYPTHHNTAGNTETRDLRFINIAYKSVTIGEKKIAIHRSSLFVCLYLLK